jgi:DNA modification methylase/superfamily II DNA or RNA helicase
MTTEAYSDFLETKKLLDVPTGIEPASALSPDLFEYQRDITAWALRRGRAAIFAGCGLGKTLMQLEWARQVSQHTGGEVLVLTPLAVAPQTIAEASRFGITAAYARNAGEISRGVVVTNYDRLDGFDPGRFAGVVLDESSILKAFDGATRTQLIESFSGTPFRLACTATPAPNDYMELGNHSEFLGVLTRAEMLATFFVHDGGETQSWRLKGHAESDFWAWLCSWAVMLRAPSDLGYSDEGFELPPCTIAEHKVPSPEKEGVLLSSAEAQTLQERLEARRVSIPQRVAKAAEIINCIDRPAVVWCNLNAESDALVAAIPDAVAVSGSDDREDKERRLLGFAKGEYRVLVTKPSIAGFGMNWQHCADVVFVGLSDSWEQYYQAVRRCWRFGQRNAVAVHVVSAEAEGAVVSNIKRKDADAERLADGMLQHMRGLSERAIHGGATRDRAVYRRDRAEGDSWALLLGDCVEELKGLDTGSVDYSVFSPPFASLYTYSASERDMGNARSHQEFFDHFRFCVAELARVIRPGRLVSFHCTNIPMMKMREGVIGIHDFRGDLIRLFSAAGFVYHSEVCIWKDPVTAMQRTKALGLLHKTIRNDSSMSRQGIPDYLVTMRAPGVNAEPIAHTREEFPVSLWQRYASPVWMDINPSDTLQHRSVREHRDEKHICPLQLGVIRRALLLWSNPGDLVLSPFAGIGSEGVVALEMGRRFVGMELKESYWTQAKANLEEAARSTATDLFSNEAAVG